MCELGTYSTSQGTSSLAGCKFQATESSPSSTDYITPIFQFKAPYNLSDYTAVIHNKMVQAVADILSVEVSIVVLTISQDSSGRRHLLQQTAGIIVSVGLRNFRGSARDFASQITQANINLNMEKVGLKLVQLVSIPITTFPGACELG
jgi:hypothetical protein